MEAMKKNILMLCVTKKMALEIAEWKKEIYLANHNNLGKRLYCCLYALY